jgi:hypothetical protein
MSLLNVDKDGNLPNGWSWKPYRPKWNNPKRNFNYTRGCWTNAEVERKHAAPIMSHNKSDSEIYQEQTDAKSSKKDLQSD